jgi:hypothetical protein
LQLSKGVYFIKLNFKEREIVKKLVVEWCFKF